MSKRTIEKTADRQKVIRKAQLSSGKLNIKLSSEVCNIDKIDKFNTSTLTCYSPI